MFHVLTFAKPEQPEPRSNTLAHTRTGGLGKRYYGKECYIVIVIYLPFQHTGLKWQLRPLLSCINGIETSDWSTISRITTR